MYKITYILVDSWPFASKKIYYFLKTSTLTFNMIGYVKSGKGMKDYVGVTIAIKTQKFRKWQLFL